MKYPEERKAEARDRRLKNYLKNGQEPREKTVTDKILKHINSYSGCRAKKFHSSAHQTDLDIYGCCNGYAFFVEVKRSAQREPTERQKKQIEAWRSAGAAAGVAYDVPSAIKILEPIL